MKLRSDFENASSNIMNRHPPPNLNVCFSELIREEKCLLTQTTLEQGMTTQMAFSAHSKGRGRDMSKIHCFSCKYYRHNAVNCPKKFCNYCKKQGHIIKECFIRPQNRQTTAFQATTESPSANQTLEVSAHA